MWKREKNSIIKSVKCRVSAKLWKKKWLFMKKNLFFFFFRIIKCDKKEERKKKKNTKIGGTKKAEDSWLKSII